MGYAYKKWKKLSGFEPHGCRSKRSCPQKRWRTLGCASIAFMGNTATTSSKRSMLLKYASHLIQGGKARTGRIKFLCKTFSMKPTQHIPTSSNGASRWHSIDVLSSIGKLSKALHACDVISQSDQSATRSQPSVRERKGALERAITYGAELLNRVLAESKPDNQKALKQNVVKAKQTLLEVCHLQRHILSGRPNIL